MPKDEDIFEEYEKIIDIIKRILELNSEKKTRLRLKNTNTKPNA